MMKRIDNRLFIATICSQHETIIDEYGIGVELDQFCQAERMDAPLNREACREIERLLKRTDRCTLHAPFSEIFPAAIDPRARSLAMERLQQAAQYAVRYDAEKMIVHSGYVPRIFYKEWHEERSVEFWEEFMAGRPGGLEIVIENVMEDEPYMMVRIMERLKASGIRLCLDTGHAICSGKLPAEEWLEAMAPYLGHLHIHNNDGTHDYHRPAYEGRIDMEAFLHKAVSLCPEDTTFTIESLDGMSTMKWLREKGFIGQAVKDINGRG